MKNEKTYTAKEILKAIKDTTTKILERNIRANEKIDNSMARTVTNMKESMLITEFYSYLIEELNIDEELLK